MPGKRGDPGWTQAPHQFGHGAGRRPRAVEATTHAQLQSMVLPALLRYAAYGLLLEGDTVAVDLIARYYQGDDHE